jgi:hypothetical protein
MPGRRQTEALLFAVLFLTGTTYADMMPAWRPDVGSVPTGIVCNRADLQPVHTANLFAGLSLIELDSRSVTCLPEAGADVTQAHRAQPPAQLFANDRSSLELCLYALLGLGLCRSAPCLKRVHMGYVPDWFHSGGAHQVGHSYVLEWNSLSSPPPCYVQPVYSSEQISSQYHEGTIVSLLRGSQFMPCTLTSHGPPLCSC